jgi:hypothetical protein
MYIYLYMTYDVCRIHIVPRGALQSPVLAQIDWQPVVEQVGEHAEALDEGVSTPGPLEQSVGQHRITAQRVADLIQVLPKFDFLLFSDFPDVCQRWVYRASIELICEGA